MRFILHVLDSAINQLCYYIRTLAAVVLFSGFFFFSSYFVRILCYVRNEFFRIFFFYIEITNERRHPRPGKLLRYYTRGRPSEIRIEMSILALKKIRLLYSYPEHSILRMAPRRVLFEKKKKNVKI